MATKNKASLEAQLLSWGSAAGLALLVFVLLLTLGGWGFIQAIWMSGVVFLLLGAFNYFVFASPNPPLAGRMEPMPASSAPRTATPETKPTPAPAAAPAPKPAAAAAEPAKPAAAAAKPAPAPAPEAGKAAGPDETKA